MKRRIVAANWKMYKTAQETTDYLQKLKPLCTNPNCEVIVFPPSLSIPAAVAAVDGGAVKIGGQNLFWEKEGAYTGELSGEMLRAAGATWVIIGHSERRQYFGETDATVLKKIRAALDADLLPMVCLGERLEEHKAGKTAEILVKQFAGGIAGLTEEQFAKVTISYEPVWAIGTGQSATPAIAEDAHLLIRSEVDKRFGEEAARKLRILYGGSVKPDNIDGYTERQDIDGALVGGASLDPYSFAKIVNAA